MKYYKGQCEICAYTKPRYGILLCFAPIKRKWENCAFISEAIAKRKCRYFKKKVTA